MGFWCGLLLSQQGLCPNDHLKFRYTIDTFVEVNADLVCIRTAQLVVSESVELAACQHMANHLHHLLLTHPIAGPFPYDRDVSDEAPVPAAAGADPVDSEAAFKKYVIPELEIMYRVARSLTRNPTDAEDLVQDTLLRAYRSVHRFDGRYPRAWLLTIMRNAQMNRVRRKRPELMRDPDVTMQRVADSSDDGQGVEQQVMHDQFDASIENALNALPEKFRTIVQLVDIDGVSYQEAADVLGVPVGTVMSRLHRARKRVRTDLEAAGVTGLSSRKDPS